MKEINLISFIKVSDVRLTNFTSAREKQLFVQTHPDAVVSSYYAVEPLYMLIDLEGSGWCLTPKCAVTYNEALDVIKHYL